MVAPQAALTTMEAAVARVAYLTSDTVFSVQASLKAKSGFSATLDALAKDNEANVYSPVVPVVDVLREAADPFLSVLESLGEESRGRLATVLTSSATLLQAVPHIYKLANLPVTVFVALRDGEQADYSEIAALRSTGLAIFQAFTTQEAQDIAVIARSVAVRSGRANIVFFESGSAEAAQADPVPRDQLERFVSTENVVAARTQAAESARLYTESAASVATADETAEQQQPAKVDVGALIETVFAEFGSQSGRSYTSIEYTGATNADAAVLLFGSNARLFREQVAQETGAGVATVRVYRPWSAQQLSAALPTSVQKLAIVEQIRTKTTKWNPLFLDVLSAYQGREDAPALVSAQLGVNTPETVSQALRGVLQNLRAEKPVQNLFVGNHFPASEASAVEAAPALESAYDKILKQIFSSRLNVANRAEDSRIPAQLLSNPEFALGRAVADAENRDAFVREAKQLAQSGSFSQQTVEALNKWQAVAHSKDESAKAADALRAALQQDKADSADVKQLLEQQQLFALPSNWIVGSDAWAADLGNGGIHHLLASGANVNMLVIDSTPYSQRSAEAARRRKKDIGLYAMQFGNAYVASTAVYSSYTQVLAAMVEADKFDGPSIVLAYLPYHSEDDTPVTVLQETKNAVESGYWPLYRYTPDVENARDSKFELDSERLRRELQDFLRRDQRLSQLARKDPKFAASLSQSYGSEVRTQQKRKARQAFDKMLESLSGPPLTILYASDGGNAENVAKRLQRRAKARTLKAKAMAMDDYPVEELGGEQNLVLITATAGQGEFPQNGRNFWDAVKNSMELDLADTKFSVFAMGDSHYWPRAADKHYYNKPGKDLLARVLALGGIEMVEIGMGDDQDPDGYETGYQAWEPELWKAMGVDKLDVVVEEPKVRGPEDVKAESQFLRGGIVAGLQDESTGAISADDALLTKFHGTYMQDDRDIRDQRKADGLEPAYSFMIRARLPAGVATPEQWCQMDEISDTYGNHTFKLTTRQTFQWHGVLKRNLKKTIAAINKALITTIAACGDVNRNVMCSTIPSLSAFHKQVYDTAKGISDHLLPNTSAYHEIWLTEDGDKKELVAGGEVTDTEPLYGPTYLPRKFKIAVAVPPTNDVDVYTNDVGFIAIRNAEGGLDGFNVSIGGGMGTTHNNKKTYPRLGTVFAFCKADEVNKVAEAIMVCQRDNGCRSDRKHARLKYTVDDFGVPFFRDFVEKYIGHALDEPRGFAFDTNVDVFGWQEGEDGRHHFGMFIENGRIEDTPDFQMKTGLREIAKYLQEEGGAGEFRLTPNQHLILSNVESGAQLEKVKDLLSKYKLDNLQFSALRLSSSACVAMPTCGLAMAESERYLPVMITKLEEVITEAGLEKDSIVMRMTGCPNGCARPWVAEIACVGKAPGTYNLYLGGGHYGQRLNKLYRASLQEGEILDVLNPMIRKYATDRSDGEKFGDFVIRMGYIKETVEGKDFHDGVDLEDETLAA